MTDDFETRALRAENRLECLRKAIEDGLQQSGKPETWSFPSKSDDWRAGALHAAKFFAETIGFKVISPSEYKVIDNDSI